MNNKQKFENFLESLKGNGQDTLIESVKKGFNICFEDIHTQLGNAFMPQRDYKPNQKRYNTLIEDDDAYYDEDGDNYRKYKGTLTWDEEQYVKEYAKKTGNHEIEQCAYAASYNDGDHLSNYDDMMHDDSKYMRRLIINNNNILKKKLKEITEITETPDKIIIGIINKTIANFYEWELHIRNNTIQ